MKPKDHQINPKDQRHLLNLMNAGVIFDMTLQDFYKTHAYITEKQQDNTKLGNWIKAIFKIREIINEHNQEGTK